MKPLRLTLLVAASLISTLSYAATLVTTVNFDSGSRTLLNNTGSTPLTGGTIADNNGDVLQLGYFSSATVADLFAGTFIPLTGEGSANTTFNKTTIGDANANGAGDGTFALSLNFTAGNAGTGNSLPANGAFLAIRFYNGLTIASSSFFQTVTDATWLFKSPSNPPANVSISLDDPGLRLQSDPAGVPPAPGASLRTSFATNAAPEPTSAALLMVGLLSLASRRRRMAKI